MTPTFGHFLVENSVEEETWVPFMKLVVFLFPGFPQKKISTEELKFRKKNHLFIINFNGLYFMRLEYQ